ncbi:tetratricopeptide repeat protein [Rhodobacteraceae bacterium XHP0102]|nr:tetratricopeptide repeat protein [Rhodobacteraceae bacterium XHP0102]
MRLTTVRWLMLGLAGPLLAGCVAQSGQSNQAAEAIGAANLNSIMLSSADPEDAVNYFSRQSSENPNDVSARRGLAQSLTRAGRAAEAVVIWRQVLAHPDTITEDSVGFAEALIRAGAWDEARDVLDQVPPTYETFERYRLEAMLADYAQDWGRADAFYETAAGLTMRPASVLNNWGYSKLTRGDNEEAERLFTEAITYDPALFTAKNNLVLARAARGEFSLPLVSMTQVERAQLLYTMALAALRQDRIDLGRGLLAEAIDTHPQYFEAAVATQRALDSGVRNQ